MERQTAPRSEDEFDVQLSWGSGRDGAAAGTDAAVDAPPKPATPRHLAVTAPFRTLDPGEPASVSDASEPLEGDSGSLAVAELQQLRAEVVELRVEVTALGRIVRDWPELTHLAAGVAALREDVAQLVEDRGSAAGLGSTLDEVRAAVAELQALAQRPAQDALPSEAAALEPLLAELQAVREELVALKRRTALRAEPAARSAAEADEIARLVAERMADGPSRRSSRR